MARKGYQAEYEAKKILMQKFGKANVIKIAIANAGSDYIVVSKGELVKCVEVKECHKKKYYPSKREIEQFKRIQAFCDEHQISGEVWVKYPRKPWNRARIEDFINPRLQEVHTLNRLGYG
jgi:Holliday junction resolvase